MFSDGSEFWTARFVFQRSLAGIYFLAFLVALRQFRALCGEQGLEPAAPRLKAIRFRDAPSLFFLSSSDRTFQWAAWTGLLLSALAVRIRRPSDRNSASALSTCVIGWPTGVPSLACHSRAVPSVLNVRIR